MKYFGYGAMSNASVVAAVIGRMPEGESGVLRGFKLCIQLLSHVPPKAQDVLRHNWPSSFRSYTITSEQDCTVAGVLWEVTEQELATIREWELVDLGWYEQIEVSVVAAIDGRLVPACTERMQGEQSFDYEADGQNYVPLLNGRQSTLQAAEKFREHLEDRS